MKNSRNFVQCLSRGFTLLSLISEKPLPLGLTELSQQTKLRKSTIQRLTHTLQKMELLDRDRETKKFRLGPKMTSIALSVVQNLDINKVALPSMQDTAADTGETVGLAILSGSDVVYTNFVKTTNVLNIERKIGDRFPAQCSASGKAILAFLPEAHLEAILQKTEWRRFTPHTITHKKELYRELDRVRSQGFATNKEETNLGAMGVAAPVRNSLGEVIAAVNIMVPTIRASKKELVTVFASKVIQTADKVSFAMGRRKESL